MTPIDQRNVSYSNVTRYVFDVPKCTIKAVKAFLIEKKDELCTNAISANVFDNGKIIMVIDYAPFGDWGRAEENKEFEFKVIKK